MTRAKNIIIQETQQATFEKEFLALQVGKLMPMQNPLQKLSPVLNVGLIDLDQIL